jgi:hypothetical protein
MANDEDLDARADAWAAKQVAKAPAPSEEQLRLVQQILTNNKAAS